MKKHELLVPAGDMDCLRQAVFHGADAVYLACKSFGARKFATNFTNEEILEAISFCHLYGVKIYVTMNTLVKNNEVDDFLDQVRFLYKNGVDAFIVQDFGMICLLREMFPLLEIHASTQANNSSIDTIRLYHELGVKRVVLSRELSIDEIDAIDVPIEKEVFIHGALCVSYSGCCLMSSMNGGRSGNRGECAGSCRLPYALKQSGKVIKEESYLLSMKEFNTSTCFDRLLNSSIDSFKIEGRMKGPLYVAFITSFYRKLIDGVPFNLEEETDLLKTIFHREFTTGHLFGHEGKELINSSSPNHIGLKIGKVHVLGDKIQILLDKGRVLRQHDAIRFLHSNKGMIINYLYDSKNKLCSFSTDTCFVDNKVGLKEDDILTKTQDSSLEKEYLISESLYKVPISFSIKAIPNKPLSLTIKDSTHQFSLEEGEVLVASSHPTTEEEIYSKLVKLGDSPFTLKDVSYEIDHTSFIPMKLLNEMRRRLVDTLITARREDKNEYLEKEVSFTKSFTNASRHKTCYVSLEEQLKVCLKLPFDCILTSSKELYLKYKEYPNIYYLAPRCMFDYSSLSSKTYVSDTMRVSESFGFYPLNITNIYTGYYLKKMGYQNIFLSVELNSNEIKEFISSYQEKFGSSEFEIFQYGRVTNMIIKSNILNIKENEPYELVDFKNHSFPVFYDGRCTHILHWEKKIDYEPYGCVTTFFYFYDENEDEIKQIVKHFSN